MIYRLFLLVVYFEPTRNNKLVQILMDALGPATRFEHNCGPTYILIKKTSISTFCFRAKRVNELAKGLWPVNAHKKPLVWPYWLRIAQIFWLNLWYISDLCLSNFVRFQAWVYELKQFYCMSCLRQLNFPLSTFLSCHRWRRTKLRRSRCKKAINTIYKSGIIGISSFGKEVLRVSVSHCKLNKNYRT